MRKKKLLPILLALAMVISLLPTTAMAVRIGDKDKTAITVNTTKVAFAGQTWWVIGDDQSGVYPQEDHITLLAANAVKDYRNVAFRATSLIGED